MAGLARVLSEVVDRLRADDWGKFVSDEGSYYYIIGLRAFDAEATGALDFGSMELGGVPSAGPKSPGPQAEWYVRSQLAAKQPDYMATARKRLGDAGITPAQIDAFVSGGAQENPLEGWRRAPGISKAEFLAAVNQFVEAWRVASGGFEPDAEEKREIGEARERLLLDRLTHRYTAMLKRAGALDSLGFADPQLHEAVECYLMGFNRAAIALAVASVETILRARTKSDDRAGAWGLVALASQRGVIDGVAREQLQSVLLIRNRVLHDARPAEQTDAEFVLDHARSVIAQLRK